jgi:tRNA(Ile)-lysidine synthase TilS/MesJ
MPDESELDKKNQSRRLEKRLNERFVKAMATYRLIEDDDKILVGLSGGKDSLLLTELLAKRARIQHPRFSIEAIHVRMENIRYETDTSYLEHFCTDLGIKLHVVTTRFDTAASASSDASSATVPVSDVSSATVQYTAQDAQSAAHSPASILRRQKQPCFLCSWNRRKQLFNLAQAIGCNKIALGHHQDDIIHTALLNLTFQAHFATMPVRLKLRKMPLTIIRPLCLITEADIKAYAAIKGYQKQQKRCPYETASHRTDVKAIFQQLEQLNPEARYNIWNALEADNKLIEE